MPVTLTFDNGPAPGVTDAVLDVLEQRGVQATFFVVGSMLERDGARELAERARDEGHWIGNHSLTHRTPLGEERDGEATRREIDGAQALLGSLAHERRFFRPFGGGGVLGPHLFNAESVELLRDGGYTCVLWSSVPRDWEDVDGWVDVALADVDRLDHAVVVLHDLPTGAMAALPRFLDALEARDVAIVQDFPADVIPIAGGEVVDVAGLVGTS